MLTYVNTESAVFASENSLTRVRSRALKKPAGNVEKEAYLKCKSQML